MTISGFNLLVIQVQNLWYLHQCFVLFKQDGIFWFWSGGGGKKKKSCPFHILEEGFLCRPILVSLRKAATSNFLHQLIGCLVYKMSENGEKIFGLFISVCPEILSLLWQRNIETGKYSHLSSWNQRILTSCLKKLLKQINQLFK